MRYLTILGLIVLWACGEHFDHSKDCFDGCDRLRQLVEPSPGPAGKDGTGCSVFKTPTGAMIECGDGTSATVMDGHDGPMGEAGPIGPSGIPGQLGNPGTSIKPVTLCPEIAGAYPEVLLCIDDKLYAVYDAGSPGSVHYTLVVPGYYRSTDGRDCRFRVVTGCEIE